MNKNNLSIQDRLVLALPHFDNIDLNSLVSLNPWLEMISSFEPKKYQISINDVLDAIEISVFSGKSKIICDSPFYQEQLEEAYDLKSLSKECELINSHNLSRSNIGRNIGIEGDLQLENVSEEFYNTEIFYLLSQWVKSLKSIKLSTVSICDNSPEKVLSLSLRLSNKPITFLALKTDQLLESLGVPRFGKSLLTLCNKFELSKWDLQLSLTSYELKKIELSFPNPARPFQLFMHSFHPNYSDKKLAIIEAALGVSLPIALNYGYNQTKWNSRYIYQLNLD